MNTDTYRGMWRAVPGYLGYLVPELIFAVAVPSALISLLATGVALVIVYVGFAILLFSLVFARAMGTLEIRRLAAASHVAITPPTWATIPGASLWQRARAVITSRDYWRYVLYWLISLPLGVVTWSLTIAWLSSAIAFLAYIPISFGWSDGTMNSPTDLIRPAMWLTAPLGFAFYAVVSTLAIVSMPYVTKGLMHLHSVIGRALLSRSSSDVLHEAVEGISRARNAAVSAEGRALRKLERDIHDGPQQLLLRLQMDLDAVERRLGDDDEAAELVREAKERSRETLNELRRLSKGIAPPLLQDRGLLAAVEELAHRNTIPTTVEWGGGTSEVEGAALFAGLDPAIAQNAYFVVSELYANAIKHSHARTIRTFLQIRSLPSRGRELLLRIDDDGVGGAVVVPGSGLAGLDERLHGLGGTLSISSPAGGPTSMIGIIPCF